MKGAMPKIFVDVGGFEGDASRAALDPIFDFSKVICFEPVRELAAAIQKRIRDNRLEVVCAALADRDGEACIFGPGTLAGSLYQDHRDTDARIAAPCALRRASTVLAPFVDNGARVFLKLNCEGAEIPILEDLLRSGVFHRLESVLLDLDARKVPALSERLAWIERQLETHVYRNWHLPEHVQYGWQSIFGGIRNWLHVSGALTDSGRARIASFRYNIELWRAHEFRGYYKFLAIRRLPKSIMRFYYKHLRRGPARAY